ncbi:BspA family leucine-rich repeat surface protein [Clostridium beijerinckii]|uniref:BspA family leucine-rich repeat surface protein n=1 Tax=Clostridium beijerinckii TaxID=1520 RepID=A0AAW3W6L2_CLOBE|nr:BspA family leucine-rich repeat surface protein [Clostridium beijerinckii]MBC2474213.1 BspA family leucine-rich repeat surface protein [Clostridium beijerinckii]NOV58688.1 surface protein [Clostridium beijerinckii]NOV71927.1 surface protein [Clostridium beijerinckii]NOW32043.1 surface protein [Clostridium beijerinckii]
MIRLKKLIASVVLSALCTPPLAVLAETVATNPGTTSASAILTTEPTVMSVTVPTSVLIYVDQQGNVTTPTDVQITNNSAAPVIVSSLAVTTEDGWTLDPSSTDYAHYKVDKKNFSLQINGKDPFSGAIAFDTPINGNESLPLALSAGVAPQKTAINASKIGNMLITVDWYGATADDTSGDVTGGTAGGTTETPVETPIETPSYPAGYVLATDADFSGTADGGFRYTGTSSYVVIPDVIKGVQVTSYGSMFANTAVKGVISTNPNITNMASMFYGNTARTLTLSLNTANVTTMAAMFKETSATTISLGTMDTGKVTNMSQMFSTTQVKSLDLTGWNTSLVRDMGQMFAYSSATSLILPFSTSSVTNMAQMFYFAQITTLDLSTFDVSKAAVNMMFDNAATTTVYARTQADVTKLSAYYSPYVITITVK